MRLAHDQLIYKALQVLYEAKEAARLGPVAPTLGLRFALAFLYANSDGPIFALPNHRYIFDQFWNTIRDEGMGKPNDNGVRGTYATTAFDQICRQVRFDFVSPEAAKVAGRRREWAEAVRQAAEEAEQAKDDKRRYYFRPPPTDVS